MVDLTKDPRFAEKFKEPQGRNLLAPEEQNFFEASGETAATIFQNLLTETGAGFSGLAQLAFSRDPEAAAEAITRFREANKVTPGERSQEQIQAIGEGVQKIIDLANVPVSGLAGIAELATGQGLDQASQTVQNVQNQGAGATFGERVLEETGSPVAATAAFVAPDLALEALGLGGFVATRPLRQAARTAAKEKGRAVTEQGKDLASEIFTTQSKAKQEVGRLLEQGVADKRTAQFELVEGQPVRRQLTENLDVDSAGNAADTLAETIRVGAPKVRKDKTAVEAIKQGFDEGVIGMVKGGSPTDKSQMKRMVERVKAGRIDPKKKDLERPGDIAGESLVDRFDFVLEENNKAGKAVNAEAKKLKGQRVDTSIAAQTFVDDLDEIGVTLNQLEDGRFEVDFRGSDIEGSAGAEKLITNVVERLSKNLETPDAFEAHRLKKFIDEQVSFGKQVEGLTATGERLVKKLRRNVDTALDETFPDYNTANTIFAETRDALDDIQDAAGRKIDFNATGGDKAAGTVLRGLLSNNRGRVNLMNSVNKLDEVAKKQGAEFDDDILAQIIFADELDNMFGTAARTSFKGQAAQAVQEGAELASGPAGQSNFLLRKGSEIVEKVRGINDEEALNVIEQLLNK